MFWNDDEKYMNRCLDLASRAEGMTYPNPVVGAVLVHDGRIIGEGFHLKAGGPHAEVVAVESVREKHLISASTLYVSLEPCSHFGKTPPCADMIIEKKIPRVVIGTADTSSKVGGSGIRRLLAAGVDVVTGVREAECRRINRRFFTYHEKRRPYITLKWAMSSDGYIDLKREPGSAPGPNWISGKAERVLVHKWRSEEESVLVGAGTVRTDDPSLNVRYWTGKDPLKLVLSKSGKLGKTLKINETNGKVIVFTSDPGHENGNGMHYLLKDDLPSALQVAGHLYELGIQSVLVEGGSEVLNHFIQNGLWDEARIFTGRIPFREGIKAPGIEGVASEAFDFESSRLEIVVNECK
jgi:diaminohydroxyphosphoribosylaminopyrimidine deaminase / 5-amino-6-(5-phosphoribosylamino)uracil reductase